MKVNEIFLSIEGEGKRAGLPAVFIRFFGCQLACTYCDSDYSCKGYDYKEMSIDDIFEEMEKYQCNNITVTGGEPLIHQDIDKFLQELIDNGYDVNVETNGTKVPPVRKERIDQGDIFYTMDYKCPTSGAESFMNMEAFNQLEDDDVVKFVVGSQEDLNQAYEIVTQLEDNNVYPQFYLSPVFGAIEPKEIVAFLLEHHLYQCKVQLQLHKYIYSPDQRGV